MKYMMKKGAALFLCLCLSAGLLTAGAGAAFRDESSITHTQAVEVLVQLKILSGKTDGAFHPTAPVTRGEMAKIIAVVMNAGRVPRLEQQEAYTYTDIADHWAKLLIEYCSSIGIVSGRGDGTFDPNGSITARECAKMLLVMVGYETDKAGFAGAGWTETVDGLAVDKGLYTGLDSAKAGETISRDDAAQMVFNALTAPRVVYWEGDKLLTEPRETGEDYLGGWFHMELKNGVLSPVA